MRTGAPTPGCAARAQLVQVGSVAGEPTDPGLKASYQDEFTIGVEKAIDPTLSVGIKGTYRSLGRTVEDRCDLELRDQPDRLLLRPHEPGRDGHRQPRRDRRVRQLRRLGQPDRPDATACTGPGQGTPIPAAKRIFKGIELVVRKQFTNEIWAQLSYLGSTLTGNYSGAIREASGQTDPGINADYDYAAVHAQLLGPPRARPAEPGPPRRGVQRPVGSVGRPPVLRPHGHADLDPGLLQQLLHDGALPRLSAATRAASRPTTR